MRFWRRRVPDEPAGDTDTIAPPAPEPAAPPVPPASTPPAAAPVFETRPVAPPPVVAPVPSPAPAIAAPAPAEALSSPIAPPLVTAPPPAPEAPAPATWTTLVDPPQPRTAEERGNWFGRLRAGLSRSSNRLNEGINAIFNRRRLDDEALEELEELLIASDMGTGVARDVIRNLRSSRFNQEVSPEEVRTALADEVIKLIEWVMKPLRPDVSKKPFVILVVGVNGSGKTTTIGKLAKQYRDAGHNVVLAAGDTFRAAAVEQLQIWGERTGSPVITRPAGSDAAGLAYDAYVQAQADGADILLIDTAGRLQNKANMMGELQKITRVLKKVDDAAPHAVLLVLDATVGQNAHGQAEIFRQVVGVTGIVMTKLDGTAKGGVLVSLAEKYGIPIHAIGIGEGVEDLRPFDARSYARSLVGLDA